MITPSKIIQISQGGNTPLYALCEDGSLWEGRYEQKDQDPVMFVWREINQPPIETDIFNEDSNSRK